MTKQEFLEGLRIALTGSVSAGVLNDNMRYYEEYIDSEIRKGKTEAEVMDSLGDPRLIAKTIIDTSSGNASQYAGESEYRSYSSGDAGRESARSDTRRTPNSFNVISGWKAMLILVGVIFVMFFILFVVFRAIGFLFWFFGPAILIFILILFIMRILD
ncbi:Uncharacterized membrane protein [Lachnospiraceae bacterium KH1T2]|nr:Uncharacterized membrane protein [Lachnospiraceae bacterium KH1T2]